MSGLHNTAGKGFVDKNGARESVRCIHPAIRCAARCLENRIKFLPLVIPWLSNERCQSPPSLAVFPLFSGPQSLLPILLCAGILFTTRKFSGNYFRLFATFQTHSFAHLGGIITTLTRHIMYEQNSREMIQSRVLLSVTAFTTKPNNKKSMIPWNSELLQESKNLLSVALMVLVVSNMA